LTTSVLFRKLSNKLPVVSRQLSSCKPQDPLYPLGQCYWEISHFC